MNTELTWQTTSIGSDDTFRLGEAVGVNLRGGELIELVSDVGGGKTTFVQGLARGAGSSDQVASPSFTISREYTARAFTIYHLDFYRLQDPGLMANELAEFINDPRAVVVIEWAGIVEDVLPAKRMQIRITAPQEQQRVLTFVYPEALGYILPEET